MSVGDSEIGFLVTNSRNLKATIRARMAQTGEPYTLASRRVAAVYRRPFTFGSEQNAFWDFNSPHLLFSEQSQYEAFFEARKAETAFWMDSADTIPGVQKTASTNIFDDAAVSYLVASKLLVEKPKHSAGALSLAWLKVLSQREEKVRGLWHAETIVLIPDLWELAEQYAADENVAREWDEALLATVGAGFTFVAMTSKPIPAAHPFAHASPFRVVGSGAGESAYDTQRLYEIAEDSIKDYAFQQALAMMPEDGAHYLSASDASRFGYIQRARRMYFEEHKQYPHW